MGNSLLWADTGASSASTKTDTKSRTVLVHKPTIVVAHVPARPEPVYSEHMDTPNGETISVVPFTALPVAVQKNIQAAESAQ